MSWAPTKCKAKGVRFSVSSTCSVDAGNQHPCSPAHPQSLHDQLGMKGLNSVMKADGHQPSFLVSPYSVTHCRLASPVPQHEVLPQFCSLGGLERPKCTQQPEKHSHPLRSSRCGPQSKLGVEKEYLTFTFFRKRKFLLWMLHFSDPPKPQQMYFLEHLHPLPSTARNVTGDQ